MTRLWKLTPVIALSVAIALLVAGLGLAIYHERTYKTQKVHETTVQAQILASTVTAALSFKDRPAAREYVRALGANAQILAAAIYDRDGTLFAGYTRANSGGLPGRVVPGPPQFAGNLLAVTVPVMQGTETLGTVWLRTITEPFAVRVERYGAIVLLVTMASLVVAVLGAAHATLSRANAELERRARDLADANAKLTLQIEEREKAEEALRQAHKMEAIGQLSGGIAHDFNNLLTVIRGNLQMMQKRIAQGRTDVAHYVDLAMDGLDRASNVTQRILAFSRRQPLSPKAVDLSRLIAGMHDLIHHSIGAHITVETKLGAECWTTCDPNQMENVLLNLAVNGRDAMPDGGTLIIETAVLHAAGPPAGFEDEVPPGDYVRLSVADTGTGMTEEVRLKAVDPFFTTKPQGQGTGLGLSMIFGYISQSEGYLNIESEPGKGTRVTILMPRRAAPPVINEAAKRPNAAAPELPVAAAPGAGMPTILIVEDEALVRLLAVETLNEAGYHVLDEGDGSAALAILEGDAPLDLLITDVQLPGVNGHKLAAAGLARRPSLRVLLMTGYSRDPLPKELAGAGVEVLQKPYDVEQLVEWAKRQPTCTAPKISHG